MSTDSSRHSELIAEQIHEAIGPPHSDRDKAAAHIELDRLVEQFDALERAAAVLVAQPFGSLNQRDFYALRELLVSNPASEPEASS